MKDLRVHGIAHDEYLRFIENGERLVSQLDVGTGYDLRRTHEQLQQELDQAFENSCLAGRVVQIDTPSDPKAEHFVLLKDAMGNTEVMTVGESIVGTLSGLYVYPEFIDDPKEVNVASLEELAKMLSLRERKRHDLRTESLAIPLDVDSHAIRARVGVTLRPFKLPIECDIDPETAFMEIPPELADYMLFVENDGPFLADSSAFRAFCENMLYELGADELTPDEVQDLANSLARESADANPALNRRVQLAVMDSEFSPYIVGRDEKRPVDIPRVRRIAGWFLGYETVMLQLGEDMDAPEIYAAISLDDDLEDITLVPLSAVVDGDLEVHTIHEEDQNIFDIVRAGFYNHLEALLSERPYAYREAFKLTADLLAELNSEEGVDLEYDKHKEFLLQLSRDSDYELGYIQNGVSVLAEDAVTWMDDISGPFRVGEGYSLPCNLLGYIANVEMVFQDSGNPLNAEDIQLMAVLQPSPYSAFRYCDANIVVVPVAGIVNSRWPLTGSTQN